MLLFPIEFKKKEGLVQGEVGKKFISIEQDYKSSSAGLTSLERCYKYNIV